MNSLSETKKMFLSQVIDFCNCVYRQSINENNYTIKKKEYDDIHSKLSFYVDKKTRREFENLRQIIFDIIENIKRYNQINNRRKEDISDEEFFDLYKEKIAINESLSKLQDEVMIIKGQFMNLMPMAK